MIIFILARSFKPYYNQNVHMMNMQIKHSNKQGLYFSGTNIRVYPLSKLFSENKNCLVINFALDHTKEITNLLANNCKAPYEIIDLFNSSG